VKEAFDFSGQQEAIREVKDLSDNSSLIILDSATGFYRIERTDNDSEALKTITRQLTVLLSLARRHNLAVLVTNQVYTDPEGDQVRPLGGHTFAHWTGVIVRLDRFRGGNRRATLEKHQSQPAGETARFKITGSGLASVQ
jgi:DNA repair protein RadB